MLRILFIDDEQKTLDPVIDAFSVDFQCERRGFDNLHSTLKDLSPDLIVLDVLQGLDDGSRVNEGTNSIDEIWKNHFCPVVVFSAQPELIQDERDEHPFVGYVKKGSKGIDELRIAITGFQVHADALSDAQRKMRSEFSIVLRDIAPNVFASKVPPDRRGQIILRSAQRRAAALLDERIEMADQLEAWEQYLIPPVAKDLLQGDILKVRDGSHETPSDFLIVLTPSCDLVGNSQRKPKVDQLLAAQCIDWASALKKVGLQPGKNLEEKLQKEVLSTGFCGSVCALPAYPQVLPEMAVDLRKLQLISLQDIDVENSTYTRVGSVDSPFREAISWAYLQIACRPGMPDRDLNTWAKEIAKAAKPRE